MGMGSETGDKAETEYQGNLDPQKIKFPSFRTSLVLELFDYFGNIWI